MIGTHFALGINVSHDRAAVIVKDGEVVTGISEERLDRIKHSIFPAADSSYLTLLPKKAIDYCLNKAGVQIEDIHDVVVVGSVVYHPRHPLRNLKLKDVTEQLPKVQPERITILNHHLAHACSAFLASPFESAAVLVADGAGNIVGNRKKGIFSVPDVEHTTAYVGSEGSLEEIYKISADRTAMNSLGALYHLVTLFAGFGQFEEGKTMGLAPFGTEELVPLFEKAVAADDPGYNIAPEFQPFDLRGRVFHRAFLDHFGEPRRPGEPIRQVDKDMAKAVQICLENRMIDMAAKLRERTGKKKLCIAGGVGLNCVANGNVFRNADFEDIFFVPCAGDDGTALGAALWAWSIKRGQDRRYCMGDAFLGIEYSEREIEKVLDEHRELFNVRWSEDVAFETAGMIGDGKIVGWFQGGSEFGPRALGHRSILFDPCREDAVEMLNTKVKKREPFRPYAPSVIESRASEFFDLDCPSPFMLIAAKVKKPQRIPGVTHVDGSARVQTVSNDSKNNRYYELLRAFESIRGVPVLLNTSFNVAGEPIVETPKDAFRCFWETDMDALVIHDVVITKKYPGISRKIAVLKTKIRKSDKKIASYESELESIRKSKGWRLITWLNRILAPWRKNSKPDIL